MGRTGRPLLIWAACDDRGDTWIYANVILSNVSPFRVSIEAEVGAHQWTVVAIDHLSFTRECHVGGTELLSLFLFLPNLKTNILLLYVSSSGDPHPTDVPHGAVSVFVSV